MSVQQPLVQDKEFDSTTSPRLVLIGSPEELVAARLDAQMSRETLAARLHVAPDKLAALETGSWELLPSLAFARGLARSVGRELNADTSGLVKTIGGFGLPSQLDGLVTSMPAKPVATTSLFPTRSASHDAQQTSLKRFIVPVFAVGAVAFVALAIGLSGSGHKLGADADQSRFVKVAVPGAASPLVNVINANNQGPRMRPAIRSTVVTVGAQAGHVKKVVMSREQLQAGLADKTAANSSAAAEPGALTFPVQLPDSEPLELTFNQAAWVDIRHKDGEKLLFGNQKARKSVLLNAVTPVQLVIGNPEGVKIRFRGEAVDLTTRTRKGISRFELK